MSAFKKVEGNTRYKNLCLLLTSLSLILSLLTSSVAALGINSRSILIGSSSPSVTTSYTVSFYFSSSNTIGSLSLDFCANDPVQGDPCILPPGLDLTNAQLTNQSGINDFSLFVYSPTSIILNRTPSVVNANQTISFTLSNVVNPSSIGQYFGRLSAYSGQGGTGTNVAYGGLAYALNSSIEVNSVVPPYIVLCGGISISNYDCNSATGDYIDFGTLSSLHSSQAQSQILAATNSPTGYVMQVYGTTLTSGNNIINPITNASVSRPGTQQFGINLRANSSPNIGQDPNGPGTGEPVGQYNIPNDFQFNSQDVIAESSNPDDFRKYTVSYLVNVNSSQPPGVYVSTLTYVGSGTF